MSHCLKSYHVILFEYLLRRIPDSPGFSRFPGSFSRRIIRTEDHETGGRTQTVQLYLSCDPNYFLISNAQRQLELKVTLL